eukprot:CAMPEP_0181188970 /NCGR_PEP_ID=MMETSP1096-20121128/11412_1 /TAXON_ID=156174 ORGANISM="Chrysochromulina ericina, Strain CCMP281" /NCGR_SAMPLE_ID=MMETSP1096 /ASSEMBLY_ACC=CAM_ASM_000453 /LENGTH=42 /DNA_ID= /DNA_START= /DNA_END= /DNA_ORIENTATION=
MTSGPLTARPSGPPSNDDAGVPAVLGVSRAPPRSPTPPFISV